MPVQIATRCFLSIVFFLFLMFTLQAEEIKKPRIEIASYTAMDFLNNFSTITGSSQDSSRFARVKKGFDVKVSINLYDYVKNFSSKHDPHLKKIIFFDYCEDPAIFRVLPREKTVLFKWEAIKIRPYFYLAYSRVYTFDDELVDGKKFKKFYLPVLIPMLDSSKLIPFQKKKFLTMIASNMVEERMKIIRFFLTKPEGDFEFYGRCVGPLAHNTMYKGPISGGHSDQDKLSVLNGYKFCICFENTHTVKGYITEKIFACFAAGCVPIYWGPSNVESYIPKECFIDYRQFPNDEAMYQYLKSITQVEYDRYREKIRTFLQSEKARLFSMEHFEQTLYEAASK